MKLSLEEMLRKNVRDLQEQNKNLMIRIKNLTEELYELKSNKKYKGWVENPDAGHIKDE
jgi:chaperonin cofactor prefoldin|tara:strand:+ start:728 stop:904 length:177 start_codon:yes stop_codon:yes gene_type:complete